MKKLGSVAKSVENIHVAVSEGDTSNHLEECATGDALLVICHRGQGKRKMP